MYDIDAPGSSVGHLRQVPSPGAGSTLLCWGDKQVNKTLVVRQNGVSLEDFRRESDSGKDRMGTFLEGRDSDRTGEDGKGFKGRGHGGRTFLNEGTVGTETCLGKSQLPSSFGQNIRTRGHLAGKIHEGAVGAKDILLQ